MAELVDCPFCEDGGAPVVVSGAYSLFDSGKANQVECVRCHATGPLCETYDEAVAAWNKRGTCEDCRTDFAADIIRRAKALAGVE